MGVNLSDLPADVRRRIEAEQGVKASGRTRGKQSRTPGGVHTGGYCATPGCGWTGNDRHPHPDKCRKTKPCDCFLSHVLATGHGRFVMDLEAL